MNSHSNSRKSLRSIRSRALGGTPERIIGLEQQLVELKSLIVQTQQSISEKKAQSILTVGEREVVTKLYNGLKIYLDPTDIAVAPHIALDGIWEASITTAWVRALKGKHAVLDIGANFGYFGLLSAYELYRQPETTVVMFEANPYLIPYINKTLSVNWFNESALVENLAITEKPGTAQLNILKDYIGCSSLQDIEELRSYLDHKMEVAVQEMVTVETVSVDSYCVDKKMPKVDLIKLDIEGFEEKAYQGMKQTIKKSPNLTVFLEFTRDAYKNPVRFYEQLLKDFTYLYTIDQAGTLVVPKSLKYEDLIAAGDDWIMLVVSKQSLQA